MNFGAGALDGNSLNVVYWNGYRMGEVITLHTAQNLTGPMRFSEVYLSKSIVSHGPINGGLNLPKERENTLMVIYI